MSRSTCIRHPENEPLIVIRQWQVALCEGNTCAASLLSFFEYWHCIKSEMRQKERSRLTLPLSGTVKKAIKTNR